jgi:Na+-transporting methylmalonyl-CoA/oxaloacetate decarboxylase gamma subunit
MSVEFVAGLWLAVVGSALVFLVLALLWGLLALLGRLDRRWAASTDATDDVPVGEAAPVEPAPVGLEPALVAAITVAVLTHRRVGRQQAAPAMRSHWPGSLPSRWLAGGRVQQTHSWQPPKRS